MKFIRSKLIYFGYIGRLRGGIIRLWFLVRIYLFEKIKLGEKWILFILFVRRFIC